MNSFLVYVIGTILVVIGLAYAAVKMGIGTEWIVIGAIVIIGIGIMGGVSKTQKKE